MKKLLLIFYFSPLFIFSQVKIDSYYNTLADENFSISVMQSAKKDKFTYYIDAKSIDPLSKQAVLMLDSDKTEEFKSFIMFLKDIHQKWSLTAKENNVTDLVKEIEYKSQLYSSAFSYGGWNIDFNTRLSAKFKIISNKYFVIINSSKLSASDNRYIKSDGYMFSFTNPSDFDDLIKKINNSEVNELLLNKAAKEDLFKN